MTWRPQQHRVGAMRERVNIQSLTLSISSAGDKSESWSNLYQNEPARYEETRGGETLRGKQVEAGIDVVFTVHYRDNIDTTCRVVHNSVNYGIVYAKKVDGGKRYLELYCKS